MKKKKQNKFLRESKPGFQAYRDMVSEFRPYLMFANADNYRNKAVNTDRLGFRKVYFKKKLLGIDQLKKNSNNINILLGTSVAFGMGSDSDKSTIQSYLSAGKKLCFSLGIRGGNSHQELLSFIKFKNFFPKVDNIIMFCGLNDIMQSAIEDSLYYLDYGGVRNDKQQAFNLLIQSNSLSKEKWIKGKTNLFFAINYLANKFNLFRKFLNIFSFIKENKMQKKMLNIRTQNYGVKINNIRKIFSNDLHTWSLVQKQMKIRIIYILQPTVTWTKREPTENERQIIKYEKKRIKNYFQKDFTTKKVYVEAKNFIEKECKKNSIEFYDSNKLIINTDKNKDFFIDFSHLSVYGNSFIAKCIKNIIN